MMGPTRDTLSKERAMGPQMSARYQKCLLGIHPALNLQFLVVYITDIFSFFKSASALQTFFMVFYEPESPQFLLDRS